MKTTATHNEKKENLYYFVQATSNETGEVQYMQVADRESAFNALEFICVRAEEKRCHYEIMKTNGGAVTVWSLDLSRSVTYCVVELAEYQRAAAARIVANLRNSNEMSFKVQIGFGMAPGRRACSYTVAWDGNKTAPSNDETRALLLSIAEAEEAQEHAQESTNTADPANTKAEAEEAQERAQERTNTAAPANTKAEEEKATKSTTEEAQEEAEISFMRTANIKDFWTYCKEYIKNNVYDYVGCSFYACDFGFDLTHEINTNGCLSDLIYSGQDGALQYLHKWWHEAADFYKYEKFEFGETRNPFEDTGGYLVCMVVIGVNSLISRTEWAEENWNEETEITEAVADRICKEIENSPSEF